MTDIKVYNLKDISELIQVTERTLLTYIKEGKLVAKKLGGKWIITEENLKAFLNN